MKLDITSIATGIIIGFLVIALIYVIPEKKYKEFCGTNSALMLSNWQTRSQLCVWFEYKSGGSYEIYSRRYTCDIWNCSFDPNTTKLYQGPWVPNGRLYE